MKKFLFGNGHGIQKRIYFWNLCSSMVYSLQSAVLLLVVTRAGGLEAAGIFSIAYTVTQTLASLGSYSMRNYQVSDTRGEFPFRTYFSSRVVTCLAMIAADLGYALFHGMSGESLAGVAIFGLYRLAEAMEDVYHSEVEKQRRLDVVSMAVTLRVVCATAVYLVLYALTRSLVLAGAGLLLSALAMMFLLNRVILPDFPSASGRWDPRGVPRLLAVTFPVFIGAILYNYLINAPKLSIFRVLNAEAQALFNILFMPIFVINILSQFVFRPMVAQMGVWWNEGNLAALRKSVSRQILFISGLTLCVVAGGYWLGCPVLGFVYGVDLSGYEGLFALLLIFGGIAALATFFSVLLTIMRRQVWITVGYVAGLIPCLAGIDRIVGRYGIWGAGYAYGGIMSLVFLVFLCACLCFMIRVARGKRPYE